MSLDSRIKLFLLCGTALAAAVLCSVQGLRFPLVEWAAPVGVVGVLGPCALFYQRRRTPQFVMTVLAVIHLLVYTSCFTVLMYATAALGAPLADEALVAADAALGVSVPAIVAWAKGHPALTQWLHLAYHSTLPQTLAVVLLLGFSADRRPLESFVLRYMLCLSITAAVFAFFPAEGPFSAYGYEPSPAQASYLEHLRTLRSGERTVISLRDAEGLVTFPSFHTAWAILLAAEVWHRRRLRIPLAALNAAVVAATLTTGWHYASDVLAGAALAAGVILLTRRLELRLPAVECRGPLC
jgi:membrane-associated phospholipid phosphatase